MSDQSKRGTFIHGIAASEHLDSSGERIQIEGVDISSLTKDGVYNYEHNSKEASSIVGKILEAKKILKRSDCESEHHKYFWDKIKMPYIYVAGELFDAVGHKEAGEVAAMVRYDQQEPINKDAKKLINFSIEGSRIEKQGAIITKCIARKISITLTPCNKVCEAEELKIDPKEEKHPDSGNFSFIQDIMSKSDEPSCQIMKGEIPFLYKAELPAIPKKPKTTIARPDAGFGAVKDKTKQPSSRLGRVIIKGKKTPVKMTAEQAVDEHEKLVDVLESPSHKDDKKEAKKQRKELKEYKEKLEKATDKPIHPKDPVFNPKVAEKPATPEYTAKLKAYLTNKKKLGKYESNMRKALTASCGVGASPAAKVQGDAVQKSERRKSLPLPRFFHEHKGLIPKDHPHHERALNHISREHREGNKLEARRLHDRYISGGGNFTLDKTEPVTYFLAKASKNVREQRKKVFGTKSQPGAGTAMRDKHLQHIQNFVSKFLGLDLQPSGGKINEKTGQRRDDDPEVGMDKPDWRSGNLESQWNPEAAIHEIAHVMLLPKGIGLEDGQRYMDKQYADVQRDYGYMKQKRSQGEVQPMAAEQLIRRFLGLPASQVSVPVKSKDAPPRVSVEDPKEVVATRVKQGKTKEGEDKWVDLIRQARNLHPEHRKRLEDVFTKKIIFDPDRGWIPNKRSIDTAITNRQPGAVVARQQRQQQKSQELPPNVIRMKQRPPKPMSTQPQQDSQNQVNPPEMAQAKMKIAKSEKDLSKAMDAKQMRAFLVTTAMAVAPHIYNKVPEIKQHIQSAQQQNKSNQQLEQKMKSEGIELPDSTHLRVMAMHHRNEYSRTKSSHHLSLANSYRALASHKDDQKKQIMGDYLKSKVPSQTTISATPEKVAKSDKDLPQIKGQPKGPAVGVHDEYNKRGRSLAGQMNEMGHKGLARQMHRDKLMESKKQPKPNLPKSEDDTKKLVKRKVKKSKIRQVMKKLGDQALERFEKKEELLKFLAEKLPNISEKERLAIAKAVAYTNEKKKELALKSLMEDNE